MYLMSVKRFLSINEVLLSKYGTKDKSTIDEFNIIFETLIEILTIN